MLEKFDNTVADVLVRGYDENDVRASLNALADAGEEAVPSILAALQQCAAGAGPDRWWDGAPRLCEVLAGTGSDEAKRGLVTILNTDSQVVEWDRIRATAAMAIGGLGDNSMIAELSAASNQPHAPVLAISEAIAALGGTPTETPEAIIERGRDLMPWEAAEYFAALAEDVSEWAPEDRSYFYFSWAGKLEVLKGKDAALPYHAAAVAANPDFHGGAWVVAFSEKTPSPEAAAELATRHPLPPDPLKAARDSSELLRALEHEKWDTVRENAAVGLGHLGDPSAVPGLIRALAEDGERSVRNCAATALGRLADERATQPLLAATQDPDWLVVEAAAGALGEIGDAAATARLEELLSYEAPPPTGPAGLSAEYGEGRVREAAQGALDKVRGRN